MGRQASVLGLFSLLSPIIIAVAMGDVATQAFQLQAVKVSFQFLVLVLLLSM